MVLLAPRFLLELSAYQSKQENPGSVRPPEKKKKADKWPLVSARGSGKVLLHYSAPLLWMQMFVVAPRRDERMKERGKHAVQSLPPYESTRVVSLRGSYVNLPNSRGPLGQPHTGSMSTALLTVGMLSVVSRLAISTCC